MDSELTLPLDVLLHIIKLLAAAGNDRDSIKSLQILSQTCKYMVPICRKHLFSSLRLRSKSISKRFSNLLLENPEIAHYVTSLSHYVDRVYYSDRISSELIILNILKVRSPLQWIELSCSPAVDWNDYPESIRLSLLSLIGLPTVTLLDINSFKGFPATALSGCTNLINLWLTRIELTLPDSEFNHVISRSKIPTPAFLNISATNGFAALLNSASLHAGASGPINFSCVQVAYLEVDSQGDIDNINKLIKLTRQLQYIDITKFHPFELAGLGESLAINASRTLRSLRLETCGIFLNEAYLDPLCGLSRELGFIAGNNILEVLQLDVSFMDASSYLTHSELWSALDSMLTDSSAFPMLRRVSFKFCWSSKDWNEPELEPEDDAIIESLKDNNFPRLVESKAVEFNFSAPEFH